jgi:RNA 2',3'-cyclic 3'-phosphodiesterase
MPRYFVAIPLPDGSRECLLTVQPPSIPGMRLIGRQELHLTLHFLGELTATSEEMVRRALGKVMVNAFTITIRGLGTFPTEGQPKVLWSGVEGNPALFALHHSAGAALSDAIGFQLEKRPYSPHVTLARLNTPALPGVIEHYLDENKGFHVPSILLKHFALYSSVLVNDIPQYREEAVFDLLQG